MTYNGFKVFLSDHAGIRTQDPLIKSQMLYQLSYVIISNNCNALRLIATQM